MITQGFIPAVFNDRTLARFRLHNESKTVKFWSKFNKEYVFLINKYKTQLPDEEIAQADREVKKLLLNEKIVSGRIESINGRFKESLSYFKAAFQISPFIILTPRFLFEFFKAMVYMPARKKIG